MQSMLTDACLKEDPSATLKPEPGRIGHFENDNSNNKNNNNILSLVRAIACCSDNCGPPYQNVHMTHL